MDLQCDARRAGCIEQNCALDWEGLRNLANAVPLTLASWRIKTQRRYVGAVMGSNLQKNSRLCTSCKDVNS